MRGRRIQLPEKRDSKGSKIYWQERREGEGYRYLKERTLCR